MCSAPTLRFSRIILAALVAVGAFAQKRPITHQDYDSWHNIQNEKLSPDGKFAAYASFPEAGDGEFIIRNLTTGKEWRQSVGQRPEPARANQTNPEDPPPAPPSITSVFTNDGSAIVFSTFPPKGRSRQGQAREEEGR